MRRVLVATKQFKEPSNAVGRILHRIWLTALFLATIAGVAAIIVATVDYSARASADRRLRSMPRGADEIHPVSEKQFDPFSGPHPAAVPITPGDAYRSGNEELLKLLAESASGAAWIRDWNIVRYAGTEFNWAILGGWSGILACLLVSRWWLGWLLTKPKP